MLERLDRRTQSELARDRGVRPCRMPAGIEHYLHFGKLRSAAVAVAGAQRGQRIAGVPLEQITARAPAVGIDQ